MAKGVEKLEDIILPTDDELKRMSLNELKALADRMLPFYLARTDGKYCFIDQNQLWKKERIWFKYHMIIKERGSYKE